MAEALRVVVESLLGLGAPAELLALGVLEEGLSSSSSSQATSSSAGADEAPVHLSVSSSQREDYIVIVPFSTSFLRLSSSSMAFLKK